VAPTNEASKQPIAGSSQHHALVVSDADESSELSEEDEYLPPVNQLGNTRPVSSKDDLSKGKSLPTTPALQAKQVSTPLNSSRKANIIAFDKSGPRNQGSTISTTKKRPVVYKKTLPKRAPLSKKDPNQKMHVDKASDKGNSSVVKKIEERQKPAKSKLGNVASTMSDAIAGLLPSKRQPVVEETATSSSKRQKLDHDSEKHASEEDDPKPIQHDYDARLEDDLLYNFDDFVRSTSPEQQVSPVKPKVVPRTASQLAMPPPKDTRQESRPAKSAVAQADAPAHSSSSRLGGHRSDRDVTRKINKSDLPTTKPNVIDQGKISDEPSVLPQQVESSSTRRVRMQETPPKAQMITTTAKRSRDGSSTRRKSSQTVDIQGSPVPRGMEIEDHSTVLEMYRSRTQQSPNSEDGVEEDLPPPPPFANNPIADLEALQSHRENVPLLNSDSILNGDKARPSAFFVTLDGIAGLQTRKKDDTLPLGKVHAENTTPNPFVRNILQELKNPKSNEKPSFPPPPDPTRKLDEQLNLLQHRLGKSKLITSKSHPDLSQDSVSNTLTKSRETTIRALTAGHALLTAPSDPKTTLSPSKLHHNLSTWRSALPPQHLNLFDELVSLAHRATQNLMDQDTAFAHSLSDYQTRSLTIIQKWENHQRSFYEQLEDSLDRKRDLLRRELWAYEKHFEDCVDAIRKARIEWEGMREERAKSERRVEAVLEEFGEEKGE
jgi:hypothetical protein